MTEINVFITDGRDPHYLRKLDPHNFLCWLHCKIVSVYYVCHVGKMVENKTKLLEEEIREAACFGDSDRVKELIARNVNVNSQNDMNGWSALHWASHRNHIDIVDCLLKNGADKTLLTKKGESAYQLSSNKAIQILLGGVPFVKEDEKLPIQPNYLTDPPLFPSKGSISVDYSSKESGMNSSNGEMVLKLRIADSDETDFIEIELPKGQLTFAKLMETCCEELKLPSNAITKVRKLPNTILRKDKDVQRLKNFQEIEVVLSKMATSNYSSSTSSTHSVTANGNQYESISLKKDQTVLY